MSKEFASQVDAYRRAAGYRSQRRLSLDAGISHSTIPRLLKGDRNATPVVAGALMHSLRVPVELRAEFLLLAAGHDATSLRETLGTVPRTSEEISAAWRHRSMGGLRARQGLDPR